MDVVTRTTQLQVRKRPAKAVVLRETASRTVQKRAVICAAVRGRHHARHSYIILRDEQAYDTERACLKEGRAGEVPRGKAGASGWTGRRTGMPLEQACWPSVRELYVSANSGCDFPLEHFAPSFHEWMVTSFKCKLSNMHASKDQDVTCSKKVTAHTHSTNIAT
eukprot:4815186-Pleurochrysis_carterae.AAC.3